MSVITNTRHAAAMRWARRLGSTARTKARWGDVSSTARAYAFRAPVRQPAATVSAITGHSQLAETSPARTALPQAPRPLIGGRAVDRSRFGAVASPQA